MPRLNLTLGRQSGSPPSTDQPLLQPGDLTYLGAMRYPKSGTSTYNGGGKVIAFAEGGGGAFGRGTIFVAGHDYFELGGQMNLRVPVIAGSVTSLSTMSAAQGGTAGIDLYGGRFHDETEAACVIGGFFPRDDGKLILSQYVYYDGNSVGLNSMFVSDQVLTPAPTVAPGFPINAPGLGITGGQSGWYGQTMCKIPTAWQAALGGNTICTGYGMSVSGRTSYGPDAIIVDINQFGVVSPVPGQRLLGYTDPHQTLTEVPPNDIYSNVWNLGSQQFNGVIFPDNTSTICYFAGHGYGPPSVVKPGQARPGTGLLEGDPIRYGEGTNNLALDGTVKSYNPVTFAIDYYIYDPANLSKGYHAYPYRQNVWMYDVRDLIKVRNGDINPATGQPYNFWEVVPYYSGTFGNVTAPFQTNGARIYGATYDPTRKIIYLSYQAAESPLGYPLIGAWSIPY